jgi:hypothetical protein
MANKPAAVREAGQKQSAPTYRNAPQDLIPLYDHEQFVFLVERESARADRAAARPRKAPRPRAAKAATELAVAETKAHASGGQPKPSSEGVWGATTDNREFSLAVFRPSSRTDRAGLVELLQCCVRTTDAVGVVDARRLGVLLPDTAAENAIHFVAKVMAIAKDRNVHLSHIVHTYPAAWPEDESPLWHEPRRSNEEGRSKEEAAEFPAPPAPLPRTQRHAAERGMIGGLVNWLQSAAFRRPARREVRASV